MTKERLGLLFILGRSDDGDRKTKDVLQVLIGRFRENAVFFDANREIESTSQGSHTSARHEELLGNPRHRPRGF